MLTGFLLFVLLATVVVVGGVGYFLVLMNPPLRQLIADRLSSIWVKLFGRREEE